MAVAVFTPCQQSHAFDERRVPLGADEVKIGRSVARLRPAAENAIFDCKVLSRNHAVLSYDEQRFYLRDTKSSNGTFVNNQRLSKGGEDSAPKEIFSGDIVQLGVDIIENAKKVTHGCIVAIVRLFHADGHEAVTPADQASDEASASSTSGAALPQMAPGCVALSAQDMFQLQQYLKEAAHRERLLEQKFTSLQSLLVQTHDASEDSWQALIDEDRLLSRIEMLESQLLLYSKNSNDDTLRAHVSSMEEEKLKYETSAKEALRRALQEKQEAVQKLTDVERSLENTEDECGRLRAQCDAADGELRALTARHADAQQRAVTLAEQLDASERRYEDLGARTSARGEDLEQRLGLLAAKESELVERIATVERERDESRAELAALSSKVVSEDAVEKRVADMQRAMKDAEQQADVYNRELDDAAVDLRHQEKQLHSMCAQLTATAADVVDMNDCADVINDDLNHSAASVEGIVSSACNSLTAVQFRPTALDRLQESLFQNQRSEVLCSHLQEFSAQLERSLRGLQSVATANGHVNERLVANGFCEGYRPIDASPPDTPPDPTWTRAADAELTHCRGQLEAASAQVRSVRSQLAHALQTADEQRSRLESERLADSSKRQALLDRSDALLADERLAAEASRREADELQKTLLALTEELQLERSVKTTSELDGDNARVVLHRQAAKNQAEFAAFKDECACLRKRVLAIEEEIRACVEWPVPPSIGSRRFSSRKENNRLLAENERLRVSSSGSKESESVALARLRGELDRAKKDADRLERAKAVEVDALRRQLDDVGYDFDYAELALRARTIGICSSVPLLILLVAIIVAYFPFFSTITATFDRAQLP